MQGKVATPRGPTHLVLHLVVELIALCSMWLERVESERVGGEGAQLFKNFKISRPLIDASLDDKSDF